MIYKRITEYTVCVLPDWHPDHHLFKLTVRQQTDGTWLVTVANGGGDVFQHQRLEVAIGHAERLAPVVSFNGRTAGDLVAVNRRG